MGTTARWFQVAALGLLVGGCAAARTIVPPPSMGPPGAPLCENLVPKASQERISGQAPDSVMVNGHKLVFPAADPNQEAATYQLLVPVSPYVVVRVRPAGHVFGADRQGSLTISYDHCPADVNGPFGVYRWNERAERWDPVSGARQLRQGRAVTVPLDSLSEYALGSPN